MAFQGVSAMDLKKEFVLQAIKQKRNISFLCDQYNIDRKTGYKWLSRFEQDGIAGLSERSRRRINQHPNKTSKNIEDLIISARKAHPAWGGRKLKRYLENKGVERLPAISTITDILRRANLIGALGKETKKNWKRFEHEQPNRLWQMDFKGDFAMESGRCFPLTVLDDHSRFALGLKSCSNQRNEAVKNNLIKIFELYGMPECINTDNGSPWGNSCQTRYTKFSVWLMQLGIKVSHSRIYHPQTNGKVERFHRTLKLELLKNNYFRDHNHTQCLFDEWRDCYNLERPHEAIDMSTPVSRYRHSHRAYTGKLLQPEYHSEDKVRKVNKDGIIKLLGAPYFIGRPFSEQTIGIRPSETDGMFKVYFYQQHVAKIDLRKVIK